MTPPYLAAFAPPLTIKTNSIPAKGPTGGLGRGVHRPLRRINAAHRKPNRLFDVRVEQVRKPDLASKFVEEFDRFGRGGKGRGGRSHAIKLAAARSRWGGGEMGTR